MKLGETLMRTNSYRVRCGKCGNIMHKYDSIEIIGAILHGMECRKCNIKVIIDEYADCDYSSFKRTYALNYLKEN